MSRPQLEQELQHIQQLNATVDLLLTTARTTRDNILLLKGASVATSALIDDWIRILSQSLFTQMVLRDPHWKDDDDDGGAAASRATELEAELRAIEAENDRLDSQLHSLQMSEDQLKRRT